MVPQAGIEAMGSGWGSEGHGLVGSNPSPGHGTSEQHLSPGTKNNKKHLSQERKRLHGIVLREATAKKIILIRGRHG